MTAEELHALRKALHYTQRDMAEEMGLGVRAYQELEGGQRDIKSRHVNSAERVALRRAVEEGNPMIAPASVRRDALALVRLIEHA